MTKLDIELKEKCSTNNEYRDGLYIGTYDKPNDRLLLFKNDKIIAMLNRDYDGELVVQGSNVTRRYTDIKPLCCVNIKVELE